jgi:hypothetical protein
VNIVATTRECGGTNATVAYSKKEELGTAEVKFWRSVAGYGLGDHKTTGEIRK